MEEKSMEQIELDFEEYRSAQLLCLEKFASFCSENGIKYFLVCGSALGAVRHKGFIPWDDDIDVAIPWYEYDKVLEKIQGQKEISIDICLNNSQRWSISDFSIILNDTLHESMIKGQDKIGIDVCIFDRVPKNRVLNCFYINLTRTLINISYAKISKEKTGSTIRDFAKAIIRFTFHFISYKQLYFVLRGIKRYFNEHLNSSNSFVGNISRGNEIHDIDQSFPTTTIKFEKRNFAIYKDVETLLKDNYGDYMELPPVGMRIPHHNKSKNYVVNNLDLYEEILAITNERKDKEVAVQ